MAYNASQTTRIIALTHALQTAFPYNLLVIDRNPPYPSLWTA